MDEHSERRPTYPKTAACACGALTVTVRAAPVKVHACTCLDCQRMSGSAFSYTAFFPESATAIEGGFRTWRRVASASRWIESSFCPQCGSGVFIRMDAMPGIVGVAVGCFADPEFERPAWLYWARRRHRWFAPPADLKVIDTQ